MHNHRFIYTFAYDHHEGELCKLESRYIFNTTEKDKMLFSSKETDPSCSAFIRKRLDIIAFSDDYPSLINDIKKLNIKTEGFKVEYLPLHGDTTRYKEQLQKLKDVGYSIDTFPDYKNPSITYGIATHNNIWYFGILTKNSLDWEKHKKKPRSYSNSIKINIAKALVNIATGTNKETKLFDAGCGVGTIILEACYAGHHIEGCDINWKTCRHARENLLHFNYDAIVYCSDIKDITQRYDVAILDLPYNLYSTASEEDIFNVIASSVKIADRLVIVSIADISDFINKLDLDTLDHCVISKPGKSTFSRKIWVCAVKN